MSDESILRDRATKLLALLQPEIDKKVRRHMLDLLIYGEATTLVTNNGSAITVGPSEEKLRGKHYDLVIIDDLDYEGKDER